MELNEILDECYSSIAGVVLSCNEAKKNRVIRCNTNKAMKYIASAEKVIANDIALAMLPFDENVYLPLLEDYKSHNTIDAITLHDLKVMARQNKITAYPLYILFKDKYKGEEAEDLRCELEEIYTILRTDIDKATERRKAHDEIVNSYRAKVSRLLKNVQA